MRSRKRKCKSSNSTMPDEKDEEENSVRDENHHDSLIKKSEQRCEFCDMVFENKYDSLIHTARHIIIPLIKQTVHICRECLYCFTSQNDLQSHMRSKHNLKTVKLSDMIDEVIRTHVKKQYDKFNQNIARHNPSNSEEIEWHDKRVGRPRKESSILDLSNVKKKKPLSKNMKTNKDTPNVLLSLLNSSNKNTRQEINGDRPIPVVDRPIPVVDSPIPVEKSPIPVEDSPILVEDDEIAEPEKSPASMQQQPVLIQPAYFVPQNNPSLPNQLMYNQIYQIQPSPHMTPEFNRFSQMQQPFLTMIPNAVLTPPKPQEEEEFILPDLEPSIRLVPSMKPNPQFTPMKDEQKMPQPIQTDRLVSILKPIQKTEPQNSIVESMGPMHSNKAFLTKHTEVTSDLVNKSPLLVKQLMMKSPEMVGNIKNRIVFEDDMDDDVICLTDMKPKINNENTHSFTNNVIPQVSNFSRHITIENGKISQEFYKPPEELRNFSISNGFLTEYSERTVHYDTLIQPGMYKCKQCPRIFPNRYDAVIHEGMSHLIIDTKINARHCAGCDYYICLSNISQHKLNCVVNCQNKTTNCSQCGLVFSDKLRHERIYHSVFRCRCGAVFNSRKDIQNHEGYSTCTIQSLARLCEVCEIFVTRKISVKFEVISVIKQYGQKFKCSKCLSMVDEVKLLKFTRRVRKLKNEEFSNVEMVPVNSFKRKKPNANTNEKRLLNIQKRLKNITQMSKF